MATYVVDKSRINSKLASKDATEYRLLFAVCFPVFLIATIGSRLLGLTSERRLESETSVYSEAKNSTHRCTSLAFLG